ncbi:MAG: serpin family protein [Phycisphaerales bacterium]|nr:MAG: serpin family protein [Phycisphaerales bacterium]
MKRVQRQLNRTALIAVVCAGSLWTCANLALAESMKNDQQAVVAGNTEFALDLYARLGSEDGNLFLSPYSISTALAMTYAGARGNTATQMAQVLHYPLDQQRLHPVLAELESSIKAAGDGSHCTLHLANALWGQQRYGFLDEFLALNQTHYGAGFREVDFVRDPEQARQTINKWVAQQTQQIIKELLQKGNLDPQDVLVLTNAIYFKGDWASRFDRKLTREAPFRISNSDQIVVPMMSQSGQFPFASHDHLDVLELPYEGDRLSMVILLPKQVGGLAAVEDSLSVENVRRWLGSLRQQDVRVSLPRLKLDFRVELSKTLEAMGMADAFSGRRADFSGMTGRRDLFIAMVIHQAYVDVNEEGTEAAAATAVKMKRSSLGVTFVADHPFLFLIRDKHTGSILFMGRLVNPGE